MPRGVYVRSESVKAMLRDRIRGASTKHGHASGGKLSPEYISWRGAVQRSVDPNTREWEHYGGRGVGICSHWRDSFPQFLLDMGTRPKGTSIERVDNDKGYLCPVCCPPDGNCRWATMSDQLKNQRHEKFRLERSERKTSWWMNKSPEYRHERARQAALARWGNRNAG